MPKTEIKKFCRRALIIEAAQFDGTFTSFEVIRGWGESDSKPVLSFTPDNGNLHAYDVSLFTPDGKMKVNPKDWIVRETDGNFYPAKPESFNKNYGVLHNKLIDDNFRKEISNIYYGFDETRKSGRSYGQALEIIGRAMQKPETPVCINDHFGTQRANKFLAKMILEIIEKLQLQHFKISLSELYLTYEIFEAQKEKTNG